MTIKEKLFANRRIHPTTGCWLWTGAIANDGYGVTTINGKFQHVHIVAYKEFKSEPNNLVLHVIPCPFKHCFNPEHLYDGTQKENIADTILLGTHYSVINSRKTHCPSGHEYTPENTRIDKKGSRKCKECERNQNRKRSKRLNNE